MSALLCALLMLSPGANPQWPGFLGAGASALSAETLPLEWSPTKNIAWAVEIPGDGQSSPIILGDQVFATSVSGDMKEEYHILAWKLSDGTPLWHFTLKNSVPAKSTLYVSRAAPTPATDGQRLYVFFESGDIVALSLEGKQLWHRSLTAEYGAIEGNHGLGASPVLTEKGVVLLVDHDGPSYLIALDKASGSTLWKTNRTSRISWSSPMLMKVGNQEQIVCSSAGSVDGYDAKTGEQAWTLGELAGNTVASPLPYAAGRFLVGASSGRGEAGRAAGAAKSNLAIELRPDDADKLAPHVMWRSDQATSSFGSPILHNQQAYWVNRSGVVYCLDAATGDVLYNKRVKQSCWATPLAIDDRIYFFGKDGHTTVLRAGDKYEVLAENLLWEPEAAAPAAEKSAETPAAAAAEKTTDTAAAQSADKPAEKPEAKKAESADPAAAMFGGTVQYGVAAVNGNLLIRTGSKLYCIRK